MTTGRILILFAALAALAACGVDGPPSAPPPEPVAPAPGVSVTGEARMGVVFSP